MDFETWIDKNGTNWKVTEMTTRQINKTLLWINETLANKMFNKVKPPDNVEMNVNMINYLIEWGGRFEMELERRKNNESSRIKRFN